MPISFIVDEDKWEKAKEIVKKQYGVSEEDGEQFYRLVMGVYKRMKGRFKSKELGIYIRTKNGIELVKDTKEDVVMIREAATIRYVCRYCGMVYDTPEEADLCCGIPGYTPVDDTAKYICPECDGFYSEEDLNVCLDCGCELVECVYDGKMEESTKIDEMTTIGRLDKPDGLWLFFNARDQVDEFLNRFKSNLIKLGHKITDFKVSVDEIEDDTEPYAVNIVCLKPNQLHPELEDMLRTGYYDIMK